MSPLSPKKSPAKKKSAGARARSPEPRSPYSIESEEATPSKKSESTLPRKPGTHTKKAEVSPLSPKKSPVKKKSSGPTALSPTPGAQGATVSEDATPSRQSKGPLPRKPGTRKKNKEIAELSPLSPLKSPTKKKTTVVRARSPEPESAVSIELEDATPSKKSTGNFLKKSRIPKVKKGKAELSPSFPKKTTAKIKSEKVPSKERIPTKVNDISPLYVYEEKEDISENSGGDSVVAEDPFIIQTNSDDMDVRKITRLTSEEKPGRSSHKSGTQGKKLLLPESFKTHMNAGAQAPPEGNSSDSASTPENASGMVNAKEGVARRKGYDNEVKRPKRRSAVAHKNSRGTNVKGQPAELRSVGCDSAVPAAPETVPEGLKQDIMSADTYAYLEISEYESFLTEPYLSEDNQLILGQPKLHKNQIFEPIQDRRVSGKSEEGEVLLVECNRVGERVAHHKSSFAMEDHSGNYWTKTNMSNILSRKAFDHEEDAGRPMFRARISRGRLPDLTDSEDCGEHVATGFISRRSSPSRISVPLAQIGSDMQRKESGRSLVFSAPSPTDVQRRLNRSVSVEWRVPPSWFPRHQVSSGPQVPRGRAEPRGHGPFQCPEGKLRTQSFQSTTTNGSPPFYPPSLSRTYGIIPQGPPAGVSPPCRRESLPRTTILWPSPPQFHMTTTDVDRSENFVNSLTQPFLTSGQPEGFYRKPFCSPEGGRICVSLPGALQPGVALEDCGALENVPETFPGASFSSITGIRTSSPNAKIVFRSLSADGPFGHARCSTRGATPNTKINVPPPEHTSIRGVSSETTVPDASRTTGQG
ncbi:hypothetical protein HPB48_007049 [Haemaphysalis longicornis]|uniref:Uncharacterized protein n=1 Tax=Haemaphysalis longicornis TaxID=44386 RepID=A0A9J6GT56_HAELO|nr:hypothetical protein HPB48_007049 [Haemaphysalis longicornis]